MALAQAAKYATTNGDSPTGQHAIDLICEIGDAITEPDRPLALIPAGVLDETAQILDRVAPKIEKDGGASARAARATARAESMPMSPPGIMRDDAGLVRTARASIDR